MGGSGGIPRDSSRGDPHGSAADIYESMSNNRTERSAYQLRELPRLDYYTLQRGLSSLRQATATTSSDEATLEESSTTHSAEELNSTTETTNQTGMDQLVAAIAELSRFQKEQEERHEQRRTEQQRQQEERMKQQREEHREQVRTMQEQHEQQIEHMLVAVRDRRPATDAHLKIVPFQANEDIQDFLEAFEGIMRIQHVDKAEWVLHLTPLLSGKARAVCTTVGVTADYSQYKSRVLQEAISCTPVD